MHMLKQKEINQKLGQGIYSAMGGKVDTHDQMKQLEKMKQVMVNSNFAVEIPDKPIKVIEKEPPALSKEQ